MKQLVTFSTSMAIINFELGKALVDLDIDYTHGHSDEWFEMAYEDDSSAENSHLYVHLCPHSHDDVGWLKTVDEYFTGAKMHIQEADVDSIITTVMDELIRDPKKRFT